MPTTTVFVASSTHPPSPSSGLSAGAIAGIVVGGVVAAILFFALGFFFLRRRRRRISSVRMPTEMEGAGFSDEDKVRSEQAKTGSHPELPGYEAAHEVESPMNRPAEMQGEGSVDSRAAEQSAGPHEMAAEN